MVGDESIPVKISGRYYNMSGEYRRLELNIATGAQGVCKFGDKLRAVRMWDLNGDLQVGGSSRAAVKKGQNVEMPMGDAVVVFADDTFKKQAAMGLAGRSVFLDGKAYELDVAADGSKIAAVPQEVKTGRARMGPPLWNGTFFSDEFVFYVPRNEQALIKASRSGASQPAPADKPIELPVGRYAFISYHWGGMHVVGSPDPGASMLQCSGLYTKAGFDVEADQTVDVPIGKTINADLSVQYSKKTATFTLKQFDGLGNQVQVLMVNGRQPEPIVEVFNESDEKIYSGKMSFG